MKKLSDMAREIVRPTPFVELHVVADRESDAYLVRLESRFYSIMHVSAERLDAVYPEELRGLTQNHLSSLCGRLFEEMEKRKMTPPAPEWALKALERVK